MAQETRAGVFVKLRDVYIPSAADIDAIEDDDEHDRAAALWKLRNFLYSEWAKFASEHWADVSLALDESRMWPEFLAAYACFLRAHKTHRKESMSTGYYYHVRVEAYDATFQCWKAISDLYRDKDDEETNFQDRLVQLSFWIGAAQKLLSMIASNQMNHGEYSHRYIEFARRAASARHAENRAMKAEVMAWLDSNMQRYKSMDSAAEAIAGRVAPVKFRTAREWVGEWKKLPSAGRP